MPHAALRSSALYRVPQVDNHLTALGYRASKAGYGDLIAAVAKAGLSANHLPSDRTVFDMMVHRTHAKYDTCQRLCDALLADASEKKQTITPVIEEHEFLVVGLSGQLGKIGKQNGMKVGEVSANLAFASGLHRPLIKAMSHKFRTTQANCERLAEAAKSLYNTPFVVTNALTFKRSSRHPFAPVPPDQEGLF